MLGCGCVLLSCLLTVTLLHCGADSLHITQDPPEYLDSAVLEDPGLPARSGEEKPGSDLTAKLLLLDQLVHLENDVIETKRKRSFTGGSAPLDRLSISNVDLGKQGKQRKVETPRRRVSAPIDRIGAGRLPSTRG
ncbi:osteocrin [Megalops cyprinoides]|uniref:osteocrin n=1 Tax=Megalops cyprinoides TaxID=118141 RepID=UPI0018650E3B|nr:osteocrin [Megalops cyprinoides]